MRTLLIVILATLALPALAQSTVNQGQGQSAGSKPWVIQGSTATSSAPVGANIAAQTTGKTTEVVVTSSAGGTYVPTTPLAGRRAIEIQNNHPTYTLYCTVDGTAPVATTNGRWILPGQAWSLDIGPLILVRCISQTNAQTSGQATMVTEVQ